MAFLYHLDPDGTLAQCWELPERPLLVGRGEFVNACVSDSSLSRAHFLVLREAGDFFVVDLESENGTWVSGQRVSGRRLHQGDVIRAGESLFFFSHFMMSPLVPLVQAETLTTGALRSG
jgi:adenylate cyclase